MTCQGNVYSRWGPVGCGRQEMVARQRELYRLAQPVMVPCFVDKGGKKVLDLQGKELKGFRRTDDGLLVSAPPPPVRKGRKP